MVRSDWWRWRESNYSALACREKDIGRINNLRTVKANLYGRPLCGMRHRAIQSHDVDASISIVVGIGVAHSPMLPGYANHPACIR